MRCLPSINLDQLKASNAAELRLVWEEQRGTPPPPTLTARLMRHALAFELQNTGARAEAIRAEKTWLTIIKQRTCDQGLRVNALPHAAAPPGTRLLKEWAGVTHELVVKEDGVHWNGERYGSLSAVARTMTGTPRNGPRFFGLRNGAAK